MPPLFSLLLLLPGVVVHGQDCNVSGDCEGNILDLTFTDSLDECVIFGLWSPGCTYVSWNQVLNDCIAYTDCTELDTTETETVSSSVECPVCHVPGLCLGNLVDQIHVDTEEQCVQICGEMEDNACQWTTYYQDGQICILLETCSSLKTCIDCYSSSGTCSTAQSSTSTPAPSTTSKYPTTTTSNAWRQEKRLFLLDTTLGSATLVSLDGSYTYCQLPDYPAPSKDPAAVNFMTDIGAVVACGEYLNENSAGGRCWYYEGGSVWARLPDSTDSHCPQATIDTVADQGWWIMGFEQTEGDTTCTEDWTSELFTGTDWVPGPAHPHNGFPGYYCVATLNATHSLFTGGYSTWTDSWLYNWETDDLTETAPLNQGRTFHGCAALEGRGAFVAGGTFTDGNGTFNVTSVEFFDSATERWSLEPALGLFDRAAGTTLLTADQTVLALLPGSDQVFQLDRNFYWTPLQGVELPAPFNGYSWTKAVLVPDNFALGCI